MKNRRQERFAELIKKNVSEIIGSVIDNFSQVFVTITDVDVSSNYMNVKINYSVLGGEEEKNKAKKLFQKFKSRLRFELGNRIEFRRVPIFSYEFDETIEKAAKIEKILSKTKKEVERFEENDLQLINERDNSDEKQ
ncbi:MAG: 30S ribosome-binding factor RbfA [Elusimicrobiota bacterium]|jgi:ribosome-binding factor A|nr:30S ribosome-binding factor RbfA [Elusimicrobiota bacterium]